MSVYPKNFHKAGSPDRIVNDLAAEQSAIAGGYSEAQYPAGYSADFPPAMLGETATGFPSREFSGQPGGVNDPRYPAYGIQGAQGPAGVESHRTDPIDPRTGSRTLHPLAPSPDQRTPYTGDPVTVDQFGNPLRADPTYVGDPAYPGYRGDPLNPDYPVRLKEPFAGFGKKFTKLNSPDRTAHNATEEAAAIADGYVYQGGAF